MTTDNLSFENRLQQLQELVNNCNKIVFFGGAGVSTESGIPDFRSSDGLYNKKDIQFEKYEPEYLLSKQCLYHNPKVFFEFYRQKLDVRNIEPNITHKKLAQLEQKNKMLGVVTQNIDGLHQKAGSKLVYEVHGTTNVNYCVKCHNKYPADFIFNSEGAIPRCPDCNQMVRPDVTLYGEQLPKAFEESINIIQEADLLIVGGTSLTVHPASTLLSYFEGKHLVLINRDNTPYDNMVDLIFRESLGEVFENLTI
jgi:NAD-dependent deacetylase